MAHILTVFGTRPEAIKLCPLLKELRERENIQVTVAVTGQHREMSVSALDAFGLRPQYDLAIMRKGQSLSDITTAVLESLSPLLEKLSPDLVLVHGDTATAFAAALAAFYAKIPVGHVEAGLRTYDMASPFPEEFNRRAISLLSTYHFAPTQGARENLLREGVEENNVFVTGNTVIDALKTTVSPHYHHPLLTALRGKRLVLLTAHRRESLGEPLRSAFRGIRQVLERHPDVALVYPVHKNPKVRLLAEEAFEECPNAYLIEPLDLVDFHNFLALCHMVITDSGGLQEEAPYFGKPVLVLREKTERPEGVTAGVLRLVGCGEEQVADAFATLLDYPARYAAMSEAVSPFGDGNASKRIADILESILLTSDKANAAPNPSREEQAAAASAVFSDKMKKN